MRIGLSLSVYEHAAALIGRSPWEVSRSGALMWEAHRAAYRLYRHGPVTVGIDIYNLEAEAYGCRVRQPTGNGIPAITEPLFSSLDQALALEPFDPRRAGRLALVTDVAARLAAEFPKADVRVPVSGPFSIAQNLLGLENLLASVALEPERTALLLEQLVEGQVAFSRAVARAGVGVAFFESAAAPPLLSPDAFRRVELPALRRAIAAVSEETGNPVPCIIGGDTVHILPEMLETGTGFLICPAETDARLFLERMRAHPEVTVRVNLDPAVYTRGTKREIAAAVDRVVEMAEGRPNVLLGTGAIPYETPVDNLLFLREYAAS